MGNDEKRIDDDAKNKIVREKKGNEGDAACRRLFSFFPPRMSMKTRRRRLEKRCDGKNKGIGQKRRPELTYRVLITLFLKSFC